MNKKVFIVAVPDEVVKSWPELSFKVPPAGREMPVEFTAAVKEAFILSR